MSVHVHVYMLPVNTHNLWFFFFLQYISDRSYYSFPSWSETDNLLPSLKKQTEMLTIE